MLPRNPDQKKPCSANILVLLMFFCSSIQGLTQPIENWLTSPAQQVLFSKQPSIRFTATTAVQNNNAIVIDAAHTFQTMDGFGFSLTGGSALNLMKMSSAARHKILTELFATDKSNIGTSYLRISIGASDLDEKVFSYDDLPAGQTDPLLKHFDLGYDKKYLLPVLKEILRINPAIKIMGSPWSPPAWMKNNTDTRGGNLLPEYYETYARYLVRYLQAMKQQGITIDAITVQNEPLHPGNNPSLQMLAPEQALFVKQFLGPAFRKNHIKTKIIIYDHNADRPDYPVSILNDTAAAKYIDGSAFHLYGGKIEALSEVHAAHPHKNLYFTEQWVGAPGNLAGDLAWHTEQLIIGASRNWCKTVLEWNLASDAKYEPHTDRGGCTSCLGAVTINGDTVTRNPAYYIIAHAAKFVRPGAVRVASTMPDGLPNAAFRNSNGTMVLIVLNTSTTKKNFTILCKGKQATVALDAGAVATYRW